MNRIEDTLNQLKEKKEKAFITYVTAGYPDLAKTKEILKAQEAAGTDIVEYRFPIRWRTGRSSRMRPIVPSAAEQR